ncbi:MAG: ATP-binding cassette domain-containing protein [Clostridia bacterium]|nr:ATP-binding cassette domain-containing protein [Clostridia bacterium]
MINLSNVCKSFGKTQVIKNVSFSAQSGQITGFIGANGSGKTTTMRLISTILKPDSGSIVVDGADVLREPNAARKKMGVLFGGDVSLYNRLTAWENILYFAKLQGMDEDEAAERIKVLSNLLDMDRYLFRRVQGFSRGMRQKVAFAKSIVHDPSTILLDEPSTGLDIYSIRDVQDFILTCKEQGKTVLVSTHNMHEIERLCDNLVIISDGRIIRNDTKQAILAGEGTDDVMEMFFRVAEGNSHA